MFTHAHIIRLSNLSPAQQRRVLLALPLQQRLELIRVGRSLLASQGVSGLGKSFFSKVGDFLKGAAKTVGNVLTGGAFSKAPEPQVVQVPVETKQSMPEWMPPVLIGGGLLLVVLVLRRPSK